MRYLVELNNFESPSEKHAREVAEAAARGETHPAKKPRMPEPQDGMSLKSLRDSPLILFEFWKQAGQTNLNFLYTVGELGRVSLKYELKCETSPRHC